MKRGGEYRYRWGEGWLIAAALGIFLALSLAVCLKGNPPAETVAPIHQVSYQEIRAVEMVDINHASVEKLSRLVGIGDVLAERIVAYREENGPFESIDALLNVEGIGKGKLEAVRSEIYVD